MLSSSALAFATSFLPLQSPVDSTFISTNARRPAITVTCTKLSRTAAPVAQLENDNTTNEAGIDVDDVTKKLTDTVSNFAQDAQQRPGFYAGATGLSVAAILAFVVSNSVLAAVNSFPVLPETLQLIGLLYTCWFIWRYLLFKETRESLLETLTKTLERTK